VSGLAILPPFTAAFLYENHEKTYLAVAAFDNPRGDAPQTACLRAVALREGGNNQ